MRGEMMKATARIVFVCCIVGAALVAIAGDGKAIQPLERAATASPATNAVAATNTFLLTLWQRAWRGGGTWRGSANML